MATVSSDIDESTIDPSTPVSGTRLGIGLLLSAAIAWACIQFIPPPYKLPERLTAGTVVNSPELQAEATALNAENQTKNALIMLSMVGAAFGFFPTLLAAPGSLAKKSSLAAGALIFGAASGAIAAFAAMQVRALWGIDDPANADAEPSMYADICIMLVQSVLIILPCALVFLSSDTEDRLQKVTVIPVAGILAGLLTPIIASFAFPKAKTDSIPITDGGLSLAWLFLIAITAFALVQMTQAKEPTITTEA